MVANERQYAVAKKKLAMLAEALDEAEHSPNPDQAVLTRQAGINGIRFLMEDLQAEIEDYLTLRNGQVAALPLPSVLDDLPSVLTRARIARGWTHRDLAKALGTTEQQVQKDERGGYTKATLTRLKRVADALGICVTGEATLARRDG